MAFWKFTVPWGPLRVVSPPPSMLDLFIWLLLYFWRGAKCRTGCFQQFGVGSGLLSSLRS